LFTTAILLNLGLVFILNVIGNCLSTLRTIFIARDLRKEAYIVTFFDAVSFACGLQLLTSGKTIPFIAAYALGKLLGTITGDIIERKLALGLVEFTIKGKRERIFPLADQFRSWNYTANTVKIYGLYGEEVFDLILTIKRKEIGFIKSTLEKSGWSQASYQIKPVTHVSGKIQTEHSLD
jgi:uncharacterized protein YebE (UPF0316 family)